MLSAQRVSKQQPTIYTHDYVTWAPEDDTTQPIESANKPVMETSSRDLEDHAFVERPENSGEHAPIAGDSEGKYDDLPLLDELELELPAPDDRHNVKKMDEKEKSMETVHRPYGCRTPSSISPGSAKPCRESRPRA